MKAIGVGTLEAEILRPKPNSSMHVLWELAWSLWVCFLICWMEIAVCSLTQVVKVYHSVHKELAHVFKYPVTLLGALTIIGAVIIKFCSPSKCFFIYCLYLSALFINRKIAVSWEHITLLIQNPPHSTQWGNVT